MTVETINSPQQLAEAWAVELHKMTAAGGARIEVDRDALLALLPVARGWGQELARKPGAWLRGWRTELPDRLATVAVLAAIAMLNAVTEPDEGSTE